MRSLLPILVLFIGLTAFCKNHDKSLRVKNKPHQSASEKTCIETVFQLDDKLGKTRNQACKKQSLSTTIIEYTKGIETLNFENCSASFKTAFQKHKNAWLKLVPITNEYPNLRGEMHELFKTIEQGNHSKEFKLLIDHVWSTWNEVEKYL